MWTFTSNILHYYIFYQVVPPILHLMLGIHKKIYDKFVTELHMIDLKLLMHTAENGEVLSSSVFDRYLLYS